ncbi:alpha/beta hydrolase [Acuticoccus kandeliae]|uniref:alpha/beta hydrolase n=1 Tax=Acuticoccus kandeliae TaxID=2073160 RepID=UPI000D3E20B8|nr:alpha/beta hydrolase [Acuticoccus kandeliae]
MTHPETEAFWNSQLQNASIIPDFDQWEKRYRDLSADARFTLNPPVRISTGTDPMQAVWRFDTGPRSNALVFIHGGYWRRFCAADFDFVTDTAKAAHATFYNVDYRLMPGVRMADVVADALAACEIATREAEHVVIAGHSAGAHLAVECALRLSRPPAAVIGLSGIYDLDPLRYSFIQRDIGLTEDEVRDFSPITRAAEIPCPVHLAAGAEEMVEFRRQSARLFEAIRAAGGKASMRFVEFRNHVSIVTDLAVKESGWSILAADAFDGFRAPLI